MFFKDLPKDVQEAVKQLPADDEFQRRFNDDEILNSLDDEKFNPEECYNELRSTLNKKTSYNGYKFNSITPKMWAYLWCIESPLVKESKKKKVTPADIDLFFYVLQNGVDDEDDDVKLIAKSFGFFRKEYSGLSYEEAQGIINVLTARAFSPLKMFPQSSSKVICGEAPMFDADWMTSIVAKVHSVTGCLPDYILDRMSLTACCFYYVQYSRMNGVENVEKKSSEEILRQQDERASQMIVERLIEKGVVKEEDKARILKIMTTPPENK